MTDGANMVGSGESDCMWRGSSCSGCWRACLQGSGSRFASLPPVLTCHFSFPQPQPACLRYCIMSAQVAASEPELVAALTSEDGPPDPSHTAQQQKQQQLGDSAVRLAGGAAAVAAADDAGSAGHGGHGGVINARQPVPWRAFVRNAPLRALAYTHFCNNWCAGRAWGRDKSKCWYHEGVGRLGLLG